jgi:hypothetical protein
MMSLAPLSELFAEIVGGALGTESDECAGLARHSKSNTRRGATSDEGRRYNRAGADL